MILKERKINGFFTKQKVRHMEHAPIEKNRAPISGNMNINGNNALTFIPKQNVPNNTKVAYAWMVYDYKPLNKEKLGYDSLYVAMC